MARLIRLVKVELLFASLLVLLIFSGCKEKQHPVHDPNRMDGLPFAHYDAIFSCDLVSGMDRRIRTRDSLNIWYQPEARFFDTTLIRLHGKEITVSIDGIRIRDSITESCNTFLLTHSVADFPAAETWSVGGAGFPNFTHSLPALLPVHILGPEHRDEIDATHPFEFLYSAPGSDRIVLHIAYQGIGVRRKDSANKMPYETGQSSYTPVANTGRYTIPALDLDSTFWRFFTPRSVLVDITSTKSDTIHVGSKIIGFVNTVYEPRIYRIKQ